VGKPCSAIPVLDGNGDQMTVYEIWDQERLFGFISERRFQLSGGEEVEPLNENTFIVAATGEKLCRLN
jgi:hypothetical protein